MSEAAPAPHAIDEDDARRALTFLRTLVNRQWRYDECCLDLAEYEEVALETLERCLLGYHNLGGSFSHYVYVRVQYALRETKHRYRAWHLIRPKNGGRPDVGAMRPQSVDMDAGLVLAERVEALPHDVKQYAYAALEGYSHREMALAEGVDESRISQRVKQWRTARGTEAA